MWGKLANVLKNVIKGFQSNPVTHFEVLSTYKKTVQPQKCVKKLNQMKFTIKINKTPWKCIVKGKVSVKYKSKPMDS